MSFLYNISIFGNEAKPILTELDPLKVYPFTFNSFGAKFQTTFVVHRLERRLYVKVKDGMSNSVDPDETAH